MNTLELPRGFIEKSHGTTRELIRLAWNKYGLGIWDYKNKDPIEIVNGIKNHDLVQQYLDENFDARINYTNDQSGKLKYYDILKLAEDKCVKLSKG